MSKAFWIYKLIRKWNLEAEIIDKILNENPELDPDPVKRIHELEDRPDKAYLWSLDCTDAQLMQLSEKVRSEFVKKNKRDPQALHLIRNDVTSLKELSPADVKESVEPWLQSQEQGAE